MLLFLYFEIFNYQNLIFQANEKLKGTVSSDKNEMLFHDFGINYNNELPIFRKGTILLRKNIIENGRTKKIIEKIADDLIGDQFWIENKEIFGENYAFELQKLSQKSRRGEQKTKTKKIEETKIDKIKE